MPDYGYLHLGRVLRQDSASGGWFLESVGLARTSRWGPVASCVPGLAAGDRVVLGAKGTSRDDLVILAKVGASFPTMSDIDGLNAALAAKADQSSLNTTNTNVSNLQASVSTNTSDISNLKTSVSSNTTSINTNTSDITTLKAQTHNFHGDPDLYTDRLATVPHASATSTFTLANGVMYVMRVYTHAVFNFSGVEMVLTGSGAGGGTINAAVYYGTSSSSYVLYAINGTDGALIGRRLAALSSAHTLAGYPHILIGVCATGFTTQPVIAATPAVGNSQVLNTLSSDLVAAQKTGSTFPANLTLNDGTWTGMSSRFLLTLAA